MRLRIAAIITKIFFVLSGTFLLFLGIFAVELGIDNDTGWGRGRILITTFGTLFYLVAIFLQFFRAFQNFFKKIAAGGKTIGSCLSHTWIGKPAHQVQSFFTNLFQASASRTPRRVNEFVYVAIGVVLCLMDAVWFHTAGKLYVWPTSTTYFDQLADAFLAGQVSLLEQPSTDLLAMQNPYDWKAREAARVSILWDASLFEGKYFLYWGPVPGVIAAGIKLLARRIVSDSFLVFLFYTGIVLMVGLILAHLHRSYFSGVPGWLLLPMILFAGMTAPMLVLINRPSVYETAIAAGQFFLLTGMYAILHVIDSPKGANKWLLLASVSWSAAIGCRLNLALAVGFFVLALTIHLWRNRSRGPFRASLLYLFIPFVLMGLGLGWYNFARFGDFLESGHRYQLTGPALPHNYEDVASIDYVIPSLYSYLFRPPRFANHEFPFVSIPYIEETMWPFFIRLPEFYYYPEPVAGLFVITPAMILMIFPLVGWVRSFRYWLMETDAPAPIHWILPPILWVIFVLGPVFLFAPLLIFISTSLRYLVDVLPAVTLMIAVGFWWTISFFNENKGRKRFLVAIAMILLCMSISTGWLSGFTVGGSDFQARNPQAFRILVEFFS